MNHLEELRKKLVLQTKHQVSIEYGEKELSTIRAVNALDDLDAAFNLLFEHSREWYHSFFPELERTVTDPELFLKLMYEIGSKKGFSGKKLEELVTDSELRSQIEKASQSSVGAIEEEKSLAEIQLLSLNALNLKQERKALESLIEEEMKKQAPNFSEIASPLLGARMLAKAGSFQHLAEMPSSTLQLLGAEKALFRHLKAQRKERPPKYGFLFAHSLIKQLHPSHKGKMARFLAGKLSIAVRMDVFGKEKIAEQLQKQLKQRFEQLQKMPAKPKPRYEPPRVEKKEFRSFEPRKTVPFESKKPRQFEPRKPMRFENDSRKPFERKEFPSSERASRPPGERTTFRSFGTGSKKPFHAKRPGDYSRPRFERKPFQKVGNESEKPFEEKRPDRYSRPPFERKKPGAYSGPSAHSDESFERKPFAAGPKKPFYQGLKSGKKFRFKKKKY